MAKFDENLADGVAFHRAALGVIRIVLENDLRLHLVDIAERVAIRLDETFHTLAKERARQSEGVSLVALGHVSTNWHDRSVRKNAVELLEFFADLPPCLIGIEACGSAHYWCRELTKLGHTVKLMAAQFVIPYRQRGKNEKQSTH